MTGLLVIATSQTLTVRKSLEKMYFPLRLKHASLMDVTISVKKFFLAGSSYSASVCAELSQIPDYILLRLEYSSHVANLDDSFARRIEEHII